MDKIYQQIANLGRKHKANKIVLYGSRARKDNRKRSDIDIAVFGLPTEFQTNFSEDIDNLETLLDFDIVFITGKTDKKLLENIEKDGVILMNKFDEKYRKFCYAVKRLEEAIDEYKQYGISSIRDGIIQRFEFCTELAWKASREYLIDQGYTDINSPKSVMKQAFADGIIDDDQIWIELLNARNKTSHIYDEETANDIINNIQLKYVILFNKLISKLQ